MTLALSLSGGGIKAAAEIGIVQALYENDIYPDVFVGTSGGSIAAGLLAFGFSPNDILSNFETISHNIYDVAYKHIAKGIFTSSYIEGLLAGDKLEQALGNMTQHASLNQIAKPLFIIATDINTGEEIIYTNTLLPPKYTKDVYALSDKAEPSEGIQELNNAIKYKYWVID